MPTRMGHAVNLLHSEYWAKLFRVDISVVILFLQQILKVDTVINSILQIRNRVEEKKLTFVG